MAETVRVLVVDDHEVLADALTEVLNAQPDTPARMIAFSARLAYSALPRMRDLCITYSALSTLASPVSSCTSAWSPTSATC